MSYQHMVNYPQAFYLKYFLGKQINCLLWNYRGYGRTRGRPNPMDFEHDANQVLTFLKDKIGVRGKIGVYGRSLGCIPATHL
jgi:pimeloyl-ACP methyl ester carboxylesterase